MAVLLFFSPTALQNHVISSTQLGTQCPFTCASAYPVYSLVKELETWVTARAFAAKKRSSSSAKSAGKFFRVNYKYEFNFFHQREREPRALPTFCMYSNLISYACRVGELEVSEAHIFSMCMCIYLVKRQRCYATYKADQRMKQKKQENYCR